jgi:hypothetical protein
MRQRSLWFSIVFLGTASAALPNVVEFQVSVDTSIISSTSGSLDFNFNPGLLVTQAASLQVLNFMSNGGLAGSPTLTGDVVGALPGTLTLDNGTAFNDYFEGFTFGTSLLFEVSLYGPALSSPDGTSTSGSTFAFSMFSDPAGTIPALTTDTIDGFAVTVDVNLDGTTTVTNSSPETSVSAVPEPSSIALVATLMGTLLWFRRRPSQLKSRRF